MTDKETENALKAHTLKDSAVPSFELDFTERANAEDGRAQFCKKVIAAVTNTGSTDTVIDVIVKSNPNKENVFGKEYGSVTGTTITSGSTEIITVDQEAPYPIVRIEDDGSGEEVEAEVSIIQT